MAAWKARATSPPRLPLPPHLRQPVVRHSVVRAGHLRACHAQGQVHACSSGMRVGGRRWGKVSDDRTATDNHNLYAATMLCICMACMFGEEAFDYIRRACYALTCRLLCGGFRVSVGRGYLIPGGTSS